LKKCRLNEIQKAGVSLLVLILWNTAMTLSGLWTSFWVVGLLVNFFLIVLVAEGLGRRIPARYKKTYERGLALAFPILLLMSWELIVKAEILSPRWFPPPSKVIGALWDLAVSYDAFTKTSLLGRPWLLPQKFANEGWQGVLMLFTESHILTTLFRVFAGFFFGTVPGIVLGVIMGMNRTIRLMLDSTMSAIYVLPKIAIFPIMMLIFANPFGEGPKIAVVAVATFFLVAINTMAGVRDIDPVYIESGKNYGANRWQMFWHVIIPAAMPVIFAGLRLALGTAIIATVAIEFVRAKKGAGFLILYYWEVMMPEKMYAALVVVMVLGAVLSYGLQGVEKRIMPWKREEPKTMHDTL
jgi:NitT/TauT family transport system permease protein